MCSVEIFVDERDVLWELLDPAVRMSHVARVFRTRFDRAAWAHLQNPIVMSRPGGREAVDWSDPATNPRTAAAAIAIALRNAIADH